MLYIFIKHVTVITGYSGVEDSYHS